MHVFNRSHEGHTLFVTGELDAHCSVELADAIDGHCGRSDTRAALDLSQVTFIDAAGLGTLLRSKLAHGDLLVISNASDPVERLLRITRLSPILLAAPPTP